jgi:hypothetical protein
MSSRLLAVHQSERYRNHCFQLEDLRNSFGPVRPRAPDVQSAGATREDGFHGHLATAGFQFDGAANPNLIG